MVLIDFDGRAVAETFVLIGEMHAVVSGLDEHVGVLLSLATLRFLYVRKVGVELPCGLEFDRLTSTIRDGRGNTEMVEFEAVSHPDID